MLRRVRTNNAVGAGSTRRWRRYQLVCGIWRSSRAIQNQIEHDQWEITIAQKQIGRFYRLDRVCAADPKKIAETEIPEWLRIERVAAINQCHKIAIAISALVKERDHEAVPALQ